MLQKLYNIMKEKAIWIVGLVGALIGALWFVEKEKQADEGLIDNLNTLKKVDVIDSEVKADQEQVNEQAVQRQTIVANEKKEENETLTPDQLAKFFDDNDSTHNQ